MKSKKMQAFSAISKMQESKNNSQLYSNQNTDSTSEGFLSLLNILNTEPLPTQDELDYISGQFKTMIKEHVSFLEYHDYCEQLGEVTQTGSDFWEIN